MDSFDKLPICAIVNGKFLAVHGGLSPDVLDVSFFNFRLWKLTKLIDLWKFQKQEVFAISFGQIQLKILLDKCQLIMSLMIQEDVLIILVWKVQEIS